MWKYETKPKDFEWEIVKVGVNHKLEHYSKKGK